MHQRIRTANHSARATTRKRQSLARLIMPAIAAGTMLGVFADWRDSKALREELGELIAEAEAIAKVAQDEGRDLDDKEKARIDEILGAGKKGEEGFKAGLVANLEAQIARMEKIESTRAQISNRLNPQGPSPSGRELRQASEDTETDDTGGGVIARVRVPSSCSRPATLKAHKVFDTKAENERAAYAMGHFFMATVCKRPQSVQWCEEHGLIQAGMTEGTPADGGYLVPTELSRNVEYWRDLHGVFRSEASYEPMIADTKDVSIQTGGLPYFFSGEATAITDTGKLAFKNVALVAKRVGTIARMSSELSEDAIIDIGERVVMAIGEAFALAEDHCGFTADGTATYGSHTGVLNLMTGLKGLYTPTGITTLDALTNAHFRKIISMIPGKYRRGCKWFCNSTVYDEAMAPILDAAGGNTQGDLEKGPGRLTFKGYPVRETQVLPEAVDVAAGDEALVFGNFQAGALFGERRKITISKNEHVYWTTDELGVKGTQRFNAKVHEVGDADTVGCFVVLKLAAA